MNRNFISQFIFIIGVINSSQNCWFLLTCRFVVMVVTATITQVGSRRNSRRRAIFEFVENDVELEKVAFEIEQFKVVELK